MMALLIVCLLGIALIGYTVMCRIDSFIEEGGVAISSQGCVNQGALVYGAPEIVAKIQKAGIRCKVLAEPYFPNDGYYSALFALSSSDHENLMVCQAAKRADPDIYIIARCNVPQLYNVFEAVGANHILNAGEQIDTLLAEFWGSGR